jgi:hypothetical protein
MPNWCNNRLVVYGSADSVEQFLNDGINDSDEWSIGTYFPMPEELEGTTSPSKETNKELIEKYGADNWYDWHLQNYGCKWDCEAHDTPSVDDINIGGFDGTLQIEFDSPWSPPTAWMKKISEKYPYLGFTLYFSEPGMNFCGVIHSQEGSYEIEEGEHEWIDGDGSGYQYDDDKDCYIDEDGEEVSAEEAEEREIELRNPFEWE